MFYGKLASNFFTVIFKGEMTFRYLTHELGKGRATKSDDFSEKFPTAFDCPPPSLIFGKLYCIFFMTDMVAYMPGDMRAR